MNRFPPKVTPNKTFVKSILLAAALIAPASTTQAAEAQASPMKFAMSTTSTANIRASAASFKRGKYEDSIAFANAAIMQGLTESRRSAAYSNLCAAHSANGNQDAALKACNQAVELKPDNWQALSNRAVVLWTAGDAAKARKDFGEAVLLAGNTSVLEHNKKLFG